MTTGIKAGADRQQATLIILSGLLAILIVVAVAVVRYVNSGDAASVITAAGATIGTLVGAYFGLNLGSAGRQKAEDSKDAAHAKLIAVAAALPPGDPTAEELRKSFI